MQYDKEQRVIVPGTTAQGVIVDATETVSDFPVYTLRWLDEAGETHTGTCGEGDLRAANPTEADLASADVEAINAAEALQLAVDAGVKKRLADFKRQQRKLDRKLARKARRKAKR